MEKGKEWNSDLNGSIETKQKHFIEKSVLKLSPWRFSKYLLWEFLVSWTCLFCMLLEFQEKKTSIPIV